MTVARMYFLYFICLLTFPLPITASQIDKLVAAAFERTKLNISYDPTYFQITYPNGDIPEDRGVCTDVIIRSYRQLGIDLQQLVHEDMEANFSLYPNLWSLKMTDTNIDHRRVPNLEVFFARKGEELPITDNPDDYKPGDIVTWNLRTKGYLPHIGIVSQQTSSNGKIPLIIHNIGRGPQCENILFSYKITGHYRYMPEKG